MATTTYGSPYVDGTDLVANWPAASLTVAQSIDAAGYYIGRGNNTQTGSYTTVLTDAGKVITMSNASANTVTIPANSSVAYVIGTRINILNLGAGACTPTAAAGVTINGTITALATNSSAAVVKTATNTWSYVPFGSGVGAAVYSDANTGTYTGYAYKTFTGSSTLTVTTAGLADVLILGAGGSGGFTTDGNNSPGGGGAGGFYGLAISTIYLPAGVLTVTIGAGGAVSAAQGSPGAATSLSSFLAVGGAPPSASGTIQASQLGASGGGAHNGAGTVNNFISQQGYSGGTATAYAPPYTNYGAGGGGGTSAVGGNGTTSVGGVGGAGSTTTIAGTTPSGAYVAGSYAFGGGGGGRRTDGSSGAGGSGGGGAASNGGAGTAGGANQGAGGGSGNTNAGAGGSGIVIVRVAV